MAGQTLFVDNVADNVEAARTLGLQAHLHTDNPTTITAIGHALTRRQ
jgi:FMN phosphatase YigB (HAD superfamily)